MGAKEEGITHAIQQDSGMAAMIETSQIQMLIALNCDFQIGFHPEHIGNASKDMGGQHALTKVCAPNDGQHGSPVLGHIRAE